jgi:hypothetical protein
MKKVWMNTKTGKEEEISKMSNKKKAFKLRLLTSKIQIHQFKITSLIEMRASLLYYLVKDGEVVQDINKLENEFVCIDDTKKGIIVTKATLIANNVSIEKLIKERRIIFLPYTSKGDDL